MAQWARAYCGDTHETKVGDAERSLRLAVVAYHECETSSKESKQKQIHRLAERVLTSRLKALKARISMLNAPGIQKRKQIDISHLRLQIQSIKDDGVLGILKEFDAP
jgi:hypothetical protein